MIAYLDCFSGISGDMLLGALLDAGLSLADLRADLSRLPLSGYEVTSERVTKRGMGGTQVQVTTEHSHAHRGLSDVLAVIAQAELPPEVARPAEQAFRRLAEAEARVHGTTVDDVHFHEVGAVDAIVDIVGAFCGLHRLGVQEVYASALPLGGGWVEAAHGRLPVPAPATAELLKGVPTYGGPVEAELVTPTGAAIVTTACRSFGPMPPMTLKAVGCGAGRLDLPHPNLLRLFLGETAQEPREQHLVVIETNLDSMNPELFGDLMDRLFAAGALDVFYTPIAMKKSRPATLVSVLTEPALVDTLSEILFRHTTTLGIRLTDVARRCLDREWRAMETDYGRVRVKVGRLGSEIVSAAPEYEDCRQAAHTHGVPIKTVYEAAQAAFREAGAALPPADPPDSEPSR
jgi:uncharacterized protein (TIGR00299 family) protein